jgi:hypothetical protein
VSELKILYEDNHLLVVNKPAGLLSQGDRSGEPTVVDVAAQYLKSRYSKPGNVYVGKLLGDCRRLASGKCRDLARRSDQGQSNKPLSGHFFVRVRVGHALAAFVRQR